MGFDHVIVINRHGAGGPWERPDSGMDMAVDGELPSLSSGGIALGLTCPRELYATFGHFLLLLGGSFLRFLFLKSGGCYLLLFCACFLL